jgi:hypothetical protein
MPAGAGDCRVGLELGSSSGVSWQENLLPDVAACADRTASNGRCRASTPNLCLVQPFPWAGLGGHRTDCHWVGAHCGRYVGCTGHW